MLEKETLDRWERDGVCLHDLCVSNEGFPFALASEGGILLLGLDERADG